MSTDPKPLPCPFCSQELVECNDNYGLAWRHPYKPGVCMALGVALGSSGDIAEWNHRPAELKLAQAIEALEEVHDAHYDDLGRSGRKIIDDALNKVR